MTTDSKTAIIRKNDIKRQQEKAGKNDLDLDKLNEISEAYMNNTNAWNDINQVEIKLAELNKQLESTTKEKTRRQINCLISTYEVQYKQLLLEKVQSKE